MSQLGKTGFIREMHIVSPPDQRGAVGAAIEGAYAPSPGSLPVTPIFLSEEEADLEIADWRAELRDLINTETNEEESDPDEDSMKSGESASGESTAESGTSASLESSSQGSETAS